MNASTHGKLVDAQTVKVTASHEGSIKEKDEIRRRLK